MQKDQGGTQLKGDPIAERTPESVRAALSERDAYAVDQIVWLVEYARSQHLGLKGLSQRIGMPAGTISQLLNNSYAGDYTARAEVIQKFRDDLEKKRIFGGRRDFVETRIATALWRIFEKTRYNRRIQVIQSPEQLGKTRAAAEYTARNNSGRTLMITLQPEVTSNGCGVFIRDLAHALGLTSDHIKALELRMAIRQKLSRCDLVIIDEWHMVKHWQERAVRALLDYIRIELHANGERGVVLIATNDDVMSTLNEFRKKSKYNLGQLLGRMCNQVLELYPDEIPPEDVDALVRRYFSPRKATVSKLYDIATRPRLGHLGLILDIMNRAWAECQVEGGEMSDELVLATAQETMEDLEKRKEIYR